MVSHPVDSAQPGSITLDREVLVHDVGGTPNALAQLKDARLVVVGALESAWAFALDPAGKTVWRYEKPTDPEVKDRYQSVYYGAVPLANGNVLLCGEVTTRTGSRGLITVLDGNGRLVQERQLLAQNSPEFFSSSLRQCLTWNGGVVAVGSASRRSGGGTPGWLLQLDASGAPVSEHVDPELRASAAVVGSAGTLLLARLDSGFTQLVRVDARLQIVAHRAIASSAFGLLRATSPTAGVKLIVYQVALKATLYSLGQQLEDVLPARALEPVYVDRGRGYVLADDSLALFGYVYKGGPYTAAIARIGSAAKTDSIDVLPPEFASFSVNDALPLTANRFATVRAVAGRTRDESGVAVSWVTFQ
jgi:hypothetical protein